MIITSTGRKVDPFAMTADDLNLRDIAHALAHLCRFTGHVREFYSVAQHCVLGSRYATPAHQLAFLLHDAAEAYLGDVSRPIKHQAFMAPYREAEQRILRLISEKWGAPLFEPEIAILDDRMLMTERRDLMPDTYGELWTGHGEPFPKRITSWLPREAEQQFLARYAYVRGIPDAARVMPSGIYYPLS